MKQFFSVATALCWFYMFYLLIISSCIYTFLISFFLFMSAHLHSTELLRTNETKKRRQKKTKTMHKNAIVFFCSGMFDAFSETGFVCVCFCLCSPHLLFSAFNVQRAIASNWRMATHTHKNHPKTIELKKNERAREKKAHETYFMTEAK